MKPLSQVKVITASVLVFLSSAVIADKDVSKPSSDWSPYALNGSSVTELFDYYASSKAIPLYTEGDSYLPFHGSESMSVGLVDGEEGFWKLSLDLNQSQTSAFSEQYRLNSAYSPNGGESTFYIDYGNRRVPVSIKVDDFLDYNKSDLAGEKFSFGFDQQLNDSWAVSISYTKSELTQKGADNSLFDFAQKSLTNQRYWFDLNKDGLPEAVNLFSELDASANFDKAAEGIEIRLTRQANEKLSFGGQVNHSNSVFNWQPYKLDGLEVPSSQLDDQSFSLFSQYDISNDWSFDANLSRHFYQQKSPQIVSLLSADSSKLDFNSTTLDIGVQYQGKWDDVGLVIRIDLMNLLGEASDNEKSMQPFDDSGLAPYTFQSPKYIKLSGSINF